MARTKASVGAKISSGKSSKARCSAAPTTSTGVSSGGSEKLSRGSGGGNPVCPRETPNWQKPITNFFINRHNDSRDSDGDGEAAGRSKPKPKPKNNIVLPDNESSPEKPKNDSLDETIELPELTGENSHKIEEYYPKGTKGKGVGKKTKRTKVVDTNEASETEDIAENDMREADDDKEACNINVNGKVTENGDGKETCDDKEIVNSKKTDKENFDINIERDDNIASDKDSVVARNKREREDRIEEEGNVNKKIKVQ